MPVLKEQTYTAYLPLHAAADANLVFALWDAEAKRNGYGPTGMPSAAVMEHRVFGFKSLAVSGPVIKMEETE